MSSQHCKSTNGVLVGNGCTVLYESFHTGFKVMVISLEISCIKVSSSSVSSTLKEPERKGGEEKRELETSLYIQSHIRG